MQEERAKKVVEVTPYRMSKNALLACRPSISLMIDL